MSGVCTKRPGYVVVSLFLNLVAMTLGERMIARRGVSGDSFHR